MATSKERAARVAREYLPGASQGAREHLAALVRRELDQQAAEAIELVRQLRPHIHEEAPARHLLAIDAFFAAHGVQS